MGSEGGEDTMLDILQEQTLEQVSWVHQAT